MTVRSAVSYNYFQHDLKKIIVELGADKLKEILKRMLLIRNFEIRAEAGYQQGFIGGFFHAYIGQEAIQTAALQAFGSNNWWCTSYRCHALALLLGATPNEIMSELFGRANGNAQGRGGSMHLYTERLMGGFGIVTGQVPVATGAGFALKYKGIKDQASICFLGDGAVPQGAFHESLNMASLWDLPCIYIIENNQWGMGTAFQRANCVDKLAETIAPSYNMEGYTLNGMDFFNCYAAFKEIYQKVLTTSRPVLVEAITERFRGHSISDPGLYRTKENMKEALTRDPISLLKNELISNRIIDEQFFKDLDKQTREIAADAFKYAEESPWPSVATLEEGVYAL